jgi:hypothetical protein
MQDAPAARARAAAGRLGRVRVGPGRRCLRAGRRDGDARARAAGGHVARAVQRRERQLHRLAPADLELQLVQQRAVELGHGAVGRRARLRARAEFH